MEDDGFTLVSKRKAAKRTKSKGTKISGDITLEEDFHCSIRKIVKIKDSLLIGEDLNEFLAKIQKQLKVCDNSSITCPVVCYGLGRVASCRLAQIQYAFLLILKELLNAEVIAYDPKFSSTDKKLLEYYGVKLISENEKGKRKVSNERTLFFMPHCDMFLYNNLLWANWSYKKLGNILVIGNSFQNIVKDHVSRHLDSKYKYILMAEKFCCEYTFPKVSNNLFEAFNNISLIYFSKLQNRTFEKDIWNNLIEPVYSDEEV